jgi:hypothetical protein
MSLRQSYPPDSRRLVPAVRYESRGGSAGVIVRQGKKEATTPHHPCSEASQSNYRGSAKGLPKNSSALPYDVYRLVGLGCWVNRFATLLFDLGPQQLGSFSPVPASVFQIQSVFAPTHKPLLIWWPFCSNHPVYLRGKIHHLDPSLS